MPDYEGLIKYPVGADRYNTSYGEVEWWHDLATTARAEVTKQVTDSSFVRPFPGTGQDFDTFTSPGLYPYWSDWAHRPSDQSGDVFVLPPPTGSGTSVAQLAIPYGSAPAIYYRFRGSVGWSAWIRLDAGAAPDSTGGGGGGSVAGFRTVPLALTVGGADAAGPTSGNYRLPVHFGADVTRWRVHFRNINPRFGTDGPNASISEVYFGPATSGAYSSAPTQIAAGLATGGGEAVTPWSDTPILAGQEYALSYAFTASATERVVGGGWSASSASSTSATLTRVTEMPLDVWVEAETAPSTPIVAAFGDSLASGVGADLPVHDSWLSQWCRDNGALPVHYACSGDTMAGWATSTAFKWTRWEDLSRPDAVIHAMGSNDIFGGADLATMKQRRAASIEQLTAMISPVVFTATIMPRTSASGATEDVRRDYNAWLKTLPDEARAWFDFVSPISADDENISPGFDSDGTHLTTSGYAAVATSISGVTPARDACWYDSGTRNVTQEFLGAYTSATVYGYLTRIGSQVEFDFRARRFDIAGAEYGDVLFTLPLGWRPVSAYQLTGAQGMGLFEVSTSGRVTCYSTVTLGAYVSFRFSHFTRDAIPAERPGTLVDPLPFPLDPDEESSNE